MGDALGNRKLVVLGLPWEVDTSGLKTFMSKFGTLDDVVVMKDRGSGRSRGFGYVTFSSSDDAEKVLETQHVLNGRALEIKVATPKEDMKGPIKGITRIFVARIPLQVTQAEFRSYFEEFGTITDVFMPKDQGSNSHRGIGFITFESPDSVEKVMAKSHELGGTMVAVDRATPKEGSGKEHGKESVKQFEIGFRKNFDPIYSGAYGAYSPYIAAAANAARFGAFGFLPYGGDYYRPHFPNELGTFGSGFADLSGSKGPSQLGANTKKIFVGRLPSEITASDLQRYFSTFGQISDVYLPKDAMRSGHKGFGFVTFAHEGIAERVAIRSHELLGHKIAVEAATPLDEAGGSKSDGGPMKSISNAPNAMMFQGSSYGPNFDHNTWWEGYGGIGPIFGGPVGGIKASRIQTRYNPYKK